MILSHLWRRSPFFNQSDNEKRASFKKCLPAQKVRANTSSGITSSRGGGGGRGPFEELLVRTASDVLNKCYPRVYFSFVGANNGGEEGSVRGALSTEAVSERATFSKRRSGAAQVHW